MDHVRYMGNVDKFMNPSDALEELTTRKNFRYVYGEFAVRDILSEACQSGWNAPLSDGVIFINTLVSNLIRLPKYDEVRDADEYYKYLDRDDNIREDILANIEFINNLMDKMDIQYHFYAQPNQDGEDVIAVRKDGGIV